jgi:tetratricopeptide (TPR) repeat protein
MKVLKNGFLFLGLFLSLSTLCLSQQYTLRDGEEIAYQAQLTLSMYKDLLNVISYKDLATESEIKKLINNSYTDSRSQIFHSAEAIIEDNIKPSNLLAQHAQDKTIRDYLNYFDLAYEKTDRATIDFYDFEVSNLKSGNHLYIKVKYTSLFKGKHKEDKASYRAVDRLAELRVEKQDNEWKTYITSIIYYQPENAINSAEGDVELEGSVPTESTFTRLTARAGEGGGTSSGELNQTDKFSEQKKAQDSLFSHQMKIGKRALDAGQLADAFVAFSEAEKIYPFHRDLQLNLRDLAKAQNLRISGVENSYAYVKNNAEKAYAARDYLKAKSLYAEALLLRPEEKNLQLVIEKLDKIIQQLALLESKYAVGDYKAAIKDYSRAIKEDRNNADYYYGRGKSYEKINAVKEAFENYTKAIALDGNFVEALSSRAQLYTKTRQYHKAIADYTLIISNPGYAAAFYPERARLKMRMGNLNGALEDYNAAIRLSPEDADLYFGKGMILLNQENTREAISAFTEAIQKDNQHASARYQRGRAFASIGNLQQASTDFADARSIGLEEAQLAEINKLTLKYYKKAEGAMLENNFSHAVQSFNEALLISPAFGRAWLRKGDAYFMLENYDSAILNYNKAIEYTPLSFGYFKRGLAYQQNKNIPAATNDFKRYIPIGKELIARTKKEKAVTEPLASLQENFVEERAEACYALGYAQLMTQQFVDAIDNLDMAIHARKFFPKAYFARGAALYALEDYKGAVKNMEESIKMGLSEPLVFYSLGRAYVANGQLKDAVFSYSHTVKIDPEFEAAFKERAICYKELGEYSAALDDIEAALSLNSALNEDVELMAQKGLVELYLNRPREANKSLDQALRMNESDAWALYGKACALAQQQKIEESLEWFRKAFQTRQIAWAAIKNDPLINPVSKQKAFKNLVKTYLN